MVTNIDTDYLQGVLIAGTYPDNTLNQYNIFTYEQPVHRRSYPSCEIIYVPEGQLQDRKQTDKTLGFEIRYYDKIVGGRSQQIDVLKQVEDVIMSLIQGLKLEDPNLMTQTFQMGRQHVQRDEDHPEYNLSTIKINIKTRTQSGVINDAILTWLTTSTVLNNPGSNYQYTEVFDTEIMEGYRSTEELVTVSPIAPGVPIRYRGGYFSRFLTHIPVKTTDVGSTGDKVNQLQTLLANGEKQQINFLFVKNTDDSPNQHTISHSVTIEIDRIEYAYPYNDFTIFRVYGFLIQPSSLSVT